MKSGQFLQILQSRCKLRGQRFVVSAIQNGDCEARLGMAVGKKIIPQAVDRNYFKRQIRAVYHPVSSRLHGFDIVVRLRCTYPKSVARQAREELAGLLTAVERCRES
ncbi:MAG: ribonuclease P protein component [Burkholderiales bacterium]|nr:ribonuclease P protein component [Burkholderiales bacterium]